MNQENQVEISNKIMDIVDTAARLAKDVRENESAVGWVKRVLKAREDASCEISALKAVVKSLLDASWNGPIDAEHPARAKAAEMLAGNNKETNGTCQDDVEEDTGKEDLRAHIIAEDPRYPTLCINGKFTYGMSMNPVTGDVDPTRHCICHSWTDDECICDLK